MKEIILEVKNIDKTFSKGREKVKALSNISFAVEKGEILGIVGESGSGKSTLANIISLMEKPDKGEVYFLGDEITNLKRRDKKKIYSNMQMVFQQAQMSFNPKINMDNCFCEIIDNYYDSRKDVDIEKLLNSVGLTLEHSKKLPSQLSGGECQRCAIARAILTRPKLLICDEATSALDVSVQAQIVNLLLELKKDLNMSIIFISHDLPLVSTFCDNILIMHNGEIVEQGKTKEVIKNPQEEYTKSLINSILEV